MKIKDRQQLLTIIALAGIALLIADWVVISPLGHLWSAHAGKIADLKKSIQDGNLTIKRERYIREDWNRMRTNTLPVNPAIAESKVVRAFYDWSGDARVSLTGINPVWKSSEDNNYTTLECRADGSGNINSVARFLYDIEKGALPIKVDAVQITSRDNAGQQLALALLVSGLQLAPPPQP